MSERRRGSEKENRFVDLFLSVKSPSRGDKKASAIAAGFSEWRSVRNANRILRARGLADSEATPTPTQPGSLIQVAPRGAAPPKSSWWVGWNPLRLTPEERYAASRKDPASGQPARDASRRATSPSDSAKSAVAPDEAVPADHIRTANGALVWREICDRPSTRAVDWSRDPRTLLSNSFAASYARPRESSVDDYYESVGLNYDPPLPVEERRGEPPQSRRPFRFVDELTDDELAEARRHPMPQAREPGESFTQAKFHQPILRRQ